MLELIVEQLAQFLHEQTGISRDRIIARNCTTTVLAGTVRFLEILCKDRATILGQVIFWGDSSVELRRFQGEIFTHEFMLQQPDLLDQILEHVKQLLKYETDTMQVLWEEL